MHHTPQWPPADEQPSLNNRRSQSGISTVTPAPPPAAASGVDSPIFTNNQYDDNTTQQHKQTHLNYSSHSNHASGRFIAPLPAVALPTGDRIQFTPSESPPSSAGIPIHPDASATPRGDNKSNASAPVENESMLTSGSSLIFSTSPALVSSSAFSLMARSPRISLLLPAVEYRHHCFDYFYLKDLLSLCVQEARESGVSNAIPGAVALWILQADSSKSPIPVPIHATASETASARQHGHIYYRAPNTLLSSPSCLSFRSSFNQSISNIRSFFFQLRGDLRHKLLPIEKHLRLHIIKNQMDPHSAGKLLRKSDQFVDGSPSRELTALDADGLKVDDPTNALAGVSRLRGGGEASPRYFSVSSVLNSHHSHSHHPSSRSTHSSSSTSPATAAPSLRSFDHPIWTEFLQLCHSLQTCSQFVILNYLCLWHLLAGSKDGRTLSSNELYQTQLMNLNDPLNLAEFLVEAIEEVQVVAQLAMMALQQTQTHNSTPNSVDVKMNSAQSPIVKNSAPLLSNDTDRTSSAASRSVSGDDRPSSNSDLSKTDDRSGSDAGQSTSNLRSSSSPSSSIVDILPTTQACDICESHVTCCVTLSSCKHSFCLACLLTNPCFGIQCPSCPQARHIVLKQTRLSLDSLIFENGVSRWEEVYANDESIRLSGNSKSVLVSDAMSTVPFLLTSRSNALSNNLDTSSDSSNSKRSPLLPRDGDSRPTSSLTPLVSSVSPSDSSSGSDAMVDVSADVRNSSRSGDSSRSQSSGNSSSGSDRDSPRHDGRLYHPSRHLIRTLLHKFDHYARNHHQLAGSHMLAEMQAVREGSNHRSKDDSTLNQAAKDVGGISPHSTTSTIRSASAKQKRTRDDANASISAPNSPNSELPPHTDIGVSCHQCKVSKNPSQLVFCTNKSEPGATTVAGRKVRPCKKKYCFECLQRLYGEGNPNPRHWICPSCSFRCICASCCRKQGRKTQSAEAKERLAAGVNQSATAKSKTTKPTKTRAISSRTNTRSIPETVLANVSTESNSVEAIASALPLASPASIASSSSTPSTASRKIATDAGAVSVPTIPPPTSQYHYDAVRSHNHSLAHGNRHRPDAGMTSTMKHGGSSMPAREGEQSNLAYFRQQPRLLPYGDMMQPTPSAQMRMQAFEKAQQGNNDGYLNRQMISQSNQAPTYAMSYQRSQPPHLQTNSSNFSIPPNVLMSPVTPSDSSQQFMHARGMVGVGPGAGSSPAITSSSMGAPSVSMADYAPQGRVAVATAFPSPSPAAPSAPDRSVSQVAVPDHAVGERSDSSGDVSRSNSGENSGDSGGGRSGDFSIRSMVEMDDRQVQLQLEREQQRKQTMQAAAAANGGAGLNRFFPAYSPQFPADSLEYSMSIRDDNRSSMEDDAPPQSSPSTSSNRPMRAHYRDTDDMTRLRQEAAARANERAAERSYENRIRMNSQESSQDLMSESPIYQPSLMRDSPIISSQMNVPSSTNGSAHANSSEVNWGAVQRILGGASGTTPMIDIDSTPSSGSSESRNSQPGNSNPGVESGSNVDPTSVSGFGHEISSGDSNQRREFSAEGDTSAGHVNSNSNNSQSQALSQPLKPTFQHQRNQHVSTLSNGYQYPGHPITTQMVSVTGSDSSLPTSQPTPVASWDPMNSPPTLSNNLSGFPSLFNSNPPLTTAFCSPFTLPAPGAGSSYPLPDTLVGVSTSTPVQPPSELWKPHATHSSWMRPSPHRTNPSIMHDVESSVFASSPASLQSFTFPASFSSTVNSSFSSDVDPSKRFVSQSASPNTMQLTSMNTPSPNMNMPAARSSSSLISPSNTMTGNATSSSLSSTPFRS